MKPRFLAAAALLVVAVLSGCARVPLGPPSASMDAITAARSSGIAPVAVGEFQLAPGRDASMDRSVSVRTNTFYSPVGGSMAQYLRDVLATQLRASGLLDPSSGTSVEGLLTDSRLDVPAGDASAALAARFVVRRGGAVVYDRELRAEERWHAPFVGAAAIPDGVNRYTALYRKLVLDLLADPAFRAAAR